MQNSRSGSKSEQISDCNDYKINLGFKLDRFMNELRLLGRHFHVKLEIRYSDLNKELPVTTSTFRD